MTFTSGFGFFKKKSGKKIRTRYLSPFFKTPFIGIQTTSMASPHIETSKNRKKEKTKYN